MSTKEAKKAKVVYTLEGDGPVQKIFREEAEMKSQVALYENATGIVEVLPEYQNYRNRISMFLADESKRFSEYAPIGTELNPKNVPPKPKKNPRYGSKTASVVEWYANYNRAVFLSKYGVKSVQRRVRIDTHIEQIRADSGKMVDHETQVPVYENNDTLEFELADVLAGRTRLIASCKTHITEKMQDSNSDPDSDWDLED